MQKNVWVDFQLLIIWVISIENKWARKLNLKEVIEKFTRVFL